eukprot:1006072-Rhodomonas_salina.1
MAVLTQQCCLSLIEGGGQVREAVLHKYGKSMGGSKREPREKLADLFKFLDVDQDGEPEPPGDGSFASEPWQELQS